MNYVLKEKPLKEGTYTLIGNFEGLEITPKKENNLNVRKIVLCDETLTSLHIKKIFEKRFTSLMRLIFSVLSSEDSGEEGARIVLDEIAKFKSSIINKYKTYMKEKEYKDAMKKLIIIEEDFKNNLMEQMYYNEQSRGKSR